MNYVLKPYARQDLDDIWYYTFNKWSLSQADFYHDELVEGIIKLMTNPTLAKLEEYSNREYLKYKVNHHYLFCRIENSSLVVIRILHESMDFQRHL